MNRGNTMWIGGRLHGVTPIAIGQGAEPVIFSHVGITREYNDAALLQQAIGQEIKKALRAKELGARGICDVSVNSQMPLIHQALVKALDIPVGVVSIYETYAMIRARDDFPISGQFLEDIRRQILRGVDMITLHATVFREDRVLLEETDRVIPTTSRGGIMMLELMEQGGFENPYHEYFGEILNLCVEYGVAVSLAPMYRPASVVDATKRDWLHEMELLRMASLVRRALARQVTVMIEGIGHASLSEIPRLIDLAKALCPGAAYRVMPISTDVAIGFDHISSAIAGAVAVQYGADSITSVTRKEHIGAPDLADTEEGVIAARIAAHSGYLARTGDNTRDKVMSQSRRKQGCLGDPQAALFPHAVYADIFDRDSCSMCGEFCPLRKNPVKER